MVVPTRVLNLLSRPESSESTLVLSRRRRWSRSLCPRGEVRGGPKNVWVSKSHVQDLQWVRSCCCSNFIFPLLNQCKCMFQTRTLHDTGRDGCCVQVAHSEAAARCVSLMTGGETLLSKRRTCFGICSGGVWGRM